MERKRLTIKDMGGVRDSSRKGIEKVLGDEISK